LLELKNCCPPTNRRRTDAWLALHKKSSVGGVSDADFVHRRKPLW
jgi:hypothetical protein